MLPDRVSNPGPLTYESGALPIALRGPLIKEVMTLFQLFFFFFFGTLLEIVSTGFIVSFNFI